MADAVVARPLDLEAFARRLARAETDRAPIEPISAQRPGLTIDDAYAIQAHGRTLRQTRGAKLVGHKIGLTSGAMQEMLGVDQPDYGYLLDGFVHPDGAHLPAERFVAPRVEAEVAFRLNANVAGPNTTAARVLDATTAVAPALEVIDSRIANWRLTIVDTIADNASCGAAVIGAWVELRELRTDLAAISMRMTVGDEVVEGRGDAVLGHPAESVAWLVQALHAQGEGLEAGEVVLSGALARALPIAAGTAAEAVSADLGAVRASF